MKNKYSVIPFFVVLFIYNIFGNTSEYLMGITVGGQLLLYDIQISHKISEKISGVASFSYLPLTFKEEADFNGEIHTREQFGLFPGQFQAGIQLDFSPWKNWFALSPGFSLFSLQSSKHITVVPDLAVAFKIGMGKNWVFKIRPSVFSAMENGTFRNSLILPWIGFTFSRRI